MSGTTSLWVVIPKKNVDFFQLKEGMSLQFDVEEEKIIMQVIKNEPIRQNNELESG